MCPRLIALALFAALMLGCGGSTDRPSGEVPDPPFVTPPVEDDPPGVLLILIDTLRADHLGVYGSDAGLTPNLDALAEQSFVFERAVAPSSWTRPSIASIMTSRYPTAVGVLDKPDRLDDSALLVSEVLQQYGGFQTFAVSTNGNTNEAFGFGQGYDRFMGPHLRRSYPGDFPIYVAEGVTQKAIEVLDGLDPASPFFLFVHYVDPHDPYLPHPGLLNEPEPPGRFDGSRASLTELTHARRDATEVDRDRIRYLYAGEVKYCDLWIGRLLDHLSSSGLDERTLVIVTTDHGEGLWDHGRRAHGNDLYEESVWAPLILRYPGMQVGDGSRIEQPVSLVDLAPTVLAAVGLESPESFQGADLRPLTDGARREPSRELVYAEMDHRGRSFESIREGDIKLIRNRRPEKSTDDEWQVFDVAADPGEQENLKDRSLPAGSNLRAALRKWNLALTLAFSKRSQIGLGELDRATLDSLRALGYIGAEAHQAALESPPDDSASAAAAELEAAGHSDFVSEIDFAEGGYSARQLMDGLVVSPAGGSIRAAAAVMLKRDERHERWWMRGMVDLGGSAGELTLRVRVDGAPALTTRISQSGEYLVDGLLPDTGGALVRVDVECERGDGGEGAGTEPPCLTLSSISLL